LKVDPEPGGIQNLPGLLCTKYRANASFFYYYLSQQTELNNIWFETGKSNA